MENLQELWRPVPGSNEKYFASNFGRVRSKYRILKLGRLRCYRLAGIEVGGKRTTMLVSKIVYLAFRGPVPDGLQVDHIDNNPENNRPENLRLLTQQENMAKSWELRRAAGHTAMHKLENHCKRGHEYTYENVRIGSDGYRYCKACERLRRGNQKVSEKAVA